MTLEEKLQLEGYRWDKDQALRDEFENDRESYLAFVRADFLNLVKFQGKARK